MNARVCSALNPEVFPKYRRSLATASTQAEIASASSGVLERVVIIVVAENAPTANDPSSATRPTGRVNCNQHALAGFAAAQGQATFVFSGFVAKPSTFPSGSRMPISRIPQV